MFQKLLEIVTRGTDISRSRSLPFIFCSDGFGGAHLHRIILLRVCSWDGFHLIALKSLCPQEPKVPQSTHTNNSHSPSGTSTILHQGAPDRHTSTLHRGYFSWGADLECTIMRLDIYRKGIRKVYVVLGHWRSILFFNPPPEYILKSQILYDRLHICPQFLLPEAVREFGMGRTIPGFSDKGPCIPMYHKHSASHRRLPALL